MRLPDRSVRRLESDAATSATSSARRGVLFHALAAATAGSTILSGAPLLAQAAAAAPANAPALPPTAPPTYTVVPTGTIADKEARLRQVEANFAADPDNPYTFGEKAQLEYEINALRTNRDFTTQLQKGVASGDQRFLQSFRVGVPNLDEAVRFWTGGLGALVLDSKTVKMRDPNTHDPSTTRLDEHPTRPDSSPH